MLYVHVNVNVKLYRDDHAYFFPVDQALKFLSKTDTIHSFGYKQMQMKETTS